VTVVALPFAIIIFVIEQRKERRNEEEKILKRGVREASRASIHRSASTQFATVHLSVLRELRGKPV
jgi:hypothetical protein